MRAGAGACLRAVAVGLAALQLLVVLAVPVAALDGARHCIRVKTSDAGSLTCSVRYPDTAGHGPAASTRYTSTGHYASGDAVLDMCFAQRIMQVTVEAGKGAGRLGERWAGTIELSFDGGSTYARRYAYRAGHIVGTAGLVGGGNSVAACTDEPQGRCTIHAVGPDRAASTTRVAPSTPARTTAIAAPPEVRGGGGGVTVSGRQSNDDDAEGGPNATLVVGAVLIGLARTHAALPAGRVAARRRVVCPAP